jgi:hypothetical protein
VEGRERENEAGVKHEIQKDPSTLKYDAMWIKKLLTFRMELLPAYSVSKNVSEQSFKNVYCQQFEMF